MRSSPDDIVYTSYTGTAKRQLSIPRITPIHGLRFRTPLTDIPMPYTGLLEVGPLSRWEKFVRTVRRLFGLKGYT